MTANATPRAGSGPPSTPDTIRVCTACGRVVPDDNRCDVSCVIHAVEVERSAVEVYTDAYGREWVKGRPEK